MDKNDIKEILKQNIVTEGKSFSQKDIDRKGEDSVEEYVRNIAMDVLNQATGDTDQSGNYFPVRLDPNIYDTGVLFESSPVLTYLESKGRRSPQDTMEVKYIQLKSGFTSTWIDETQDEGATNDTANTGTATADMKIHLMPITMSDLIGKGASGTARAQLMNFAQEGFREDLNAQIVSGTAGSYSFNGLDTLATANTSVASGHARIDMSGAVMDLDTLNKMDTVFSDELRSRPTFVMTSAVVEDQIEKDMSSIARADNEMPITAGIEVPYFRSDAGKIPIITDPNVPKTATQRHLDMFNERQIFIQDFMTPSFITKGRDKPFASTGWLAEILVQYHVSPTQMVQAYDIL